MDINKVVNDSMSQQVAQIVIQYVPKTGQLGLQSSNVDDVMKLGMLEMAKALVNEARMKAASSPIAVPQGVKLS